MREVDDSPNRCPRCQRVQLSAEICEKCRENRIGKWTVTFEYGYYYATHDDYDASWEGEEDGWVDNGMRVSARTREELLEEIKEFEKE